MLRILGEMRIGEARLRFRSRRAHELLGLLAVGPEEGIARGTATATLWPEAEPERAAHNLRQTLVYLREALHEAGAKEELAVDRERLRLCLAIDGREFARLASGAAEGWPRALELDSGPLLPGLDNEWVSRARDAHENLRLNLLVNLSGVLLASDPAEALRLARLATESDELLESARRATVEALVALGERPRAVEEFAAYDRLLRAELGLAASPLLREIAFGEASESAEESEPPLSPGGRLAVATGLAPRYEASERFGAGRAALVAALEGAATAPPDARAIALAWIARFEFALGDWYASVEHARSAVELAHGGGAIAFARIQLARALTWTSSAEEALPLAESVLRAAKVRRDLELGAEALLTLGAGAWHTGDLRRSSRLYARAGRWAARARSPVQETRAFLSLAALRLRLDGPEEAIVVATRANGAAARSGIASLTAHARGDLARYREGAGELEEARRGYAAALVATEGGRNPLTRSQILTYMGDLETRLRRPEAARVHHEEAVALRRVAGDRVALATSLRGLGKALVALGELAEAQVAFLEALRLFDATWAMEARVTVRLPLARTLLAQGKKAEAQTQAQIALEEWAELGAISRDAQVTDGSLSEEAVAAFRAEFTTAGIPL